MLKKIILVLSATAMAGYLASPLIANAEPVKTAKIQLADDASSTSMPSSGGNGSPAADGSSDNGAADANGDGSSDTSDAFTPAPAPSDSDQGDASSAGDSSDDDSQGSSPTDQNSAE